MRNLACKKFRNEHSSANLLGVETIVTKFKGGLPAGTLETVAGVADGRDQLQVVKNSRKGQSVPRKANTRIVNLFRPLYR